MQNDPSRPPVVDIGTLVIAFPSGTQPAPDKKIVLEGLRPGDPPGGIGRQRLELIGGNAATVGTDGTFRIPLPSQGTFWVLILSKNSPRSSNTKLFQSEVENLESLFRGCDIGPGKESLFARQSSYEESREQPDHARFPLCSLAFVPGNSSP